MNKSISFNVATLVFLTMSLSLFSGQLFANSDVEKGKQVYQTCIVCHGTNGEGNDALNAPALAGQYDWYLERQLHNFKNGLRGSQPNDSQGQQMAAMAKTLADDSAISEVSAYIANLEKLNQPPLANNANIRNGNNKYNAQCGACHGSTAKGNMSLNAPNLTILSTQYLIAQMNNFKLNLRGYHRDDKLGRQMKMMANMVTKDEDLADIVSFINAQSVQ